MTQLDQVTQKICSRLTRVRIRGSATELSYIPPMSRGLAVCVFASTTFGLGGCGLGGLSSATAGRSGMSGGAGAGGAPPTGGSAGVAAGSAATDCTAVAADVCPMPTGIAFACKQRFALGINYAWRNFGSDFGGLAAWSIQGVAAAPAEYAADLSQMKAAGASVIRWWVFPEFRGDGVLFDAARPHRPVAGGAGRPAKSARAGPASRRLPGTDPLFIRRFSPQAHAEGVTIRSMTGLVSTPARRAKLIANVVQPLARAAATSAHATRLMVGTHQRARVGDRAHRQSAQDFDPNEELEPVALADMKAFIVEAAAVLKQETSAAFTSVAGPRPSGLGRSATCSSTSITPHYGWVNQYWPYTRTPEQLGYPAQRPTIMGEFFLQSMPFADGGENASLGQILLRWWDSGYAGAWPWQHFDQAANLPLLKAFADSKGCQAGF